MNNIKRLIVIVLATFGIFAIAACGKKDKDLTRHIPQDAASVISINIGQVLSKVDMAELRKSFLVKMFEQGLRQEKVPNFLEDPEVIGIDIEENIYVIFSADDNDEAMMLAKVEKKKKLQEFAKSFGEKVESADEFDYIQLGNDMLAWNGDLAVMITGSNDSKDGLVKRMNGVFGMPEDQSISGKFDSFDEFIATGADLALWMRPDQVNMKRMNIPNPSQIGGLTKGEQFMTLNFEPGQIHLHGRYFPDEAGKAEMKQLLSNEFDEALLQNIPGGDIFGFVSISLNPDHLSKMMEANTNEALQQEWLQKVAGYIEGDVFIGAVGMQDKMAADSLGEGGMSFMPAMPEPVIYATFTFKDTTGLDSLFAMAGDSIMAKKENYYDLGEGKIFFRKGARGYVTNSRNYQAMMSNLQSSGNTLNDNQRKLATTYPFVLFIDVKKLASEYMKVSRDEGQAGMINILAEEINTIEITAEPYNDKYLSGDLYIRMKDKETNSLQVVVNIIMQMMAGMGGMF